jgi:hypothetical protein
MHRARTCGVVLLVGALAAGAFAVVLYQLIMRPQEVAELAPRDWS